MADKPVKKITKTINGTEYGLQVESAIRDGQGNIIDASKVDVEFGATNQVVPSSTLATGGLFLEEQSKTDDYTVEKPYKKVANNGNEDDKAKVVFSLDVLDGASDVNLTEVEISSIVAKDSTNLVTGGGVYDAINAARHATVLNVSASQALNNISFIQIPSLTVENIELLAQAYMDHQRVMIYFTPSGGVPHYFTIDSANYTTAVGANHSAEIHLHYDLAEQIGKSYCIELMYCVTDSDDPEVFSNPSLMPITGTQTYEGIDEQLPILTSAMIDDIVNTYISGRDNKLLFISANGDVVLTTVIDLGYRADSSIFSQNVCYYVTLAWNNNIYTFYKGKGAVKAVKTGGDGKGAYILHMIYDETADNVFDFDLNEFKGALAASLKDTPVYCVLNVLSDGGSTTDSLNAVEIETIEAIYDTTQTPAVITSGYIVVHILNGFTDNISKTFANNLRYTVCYDAEDEEAGLSWVLLPTTIKTVNGNAPDENGNVSVALPESGYIKPTNGIPASDMTAEVRASLGKANTAVQPAAIEDMETKTDAANNYVSLTTAQNITGQKTFTNSVIVKNLEYAASDKPSVSSDKFFLIRGSDGNNVGYVGARIGGGSSTSTNAFNTLLLGCLNKSGKTGLIHFQVGGDDETVSGGVLPGTNAAFNLGGTNYMWKNLHLSGDIYKNGTKVNIPTITVDNDGYINITTS